ncbi:MAG: hypothetical protein IPG96_07580 [Proteobacteria bacterium]|nr:hypothetical protein [Pseudomonadota bacterium]
MDGRQPAQRDRCGAGVDAAALLHLRRDSPGHRRPPLCPAPARAGDDDLRLVGGPWTRGQLLRAAAPGLPELALLALDWIAFREAFDTAALDARFAPIHAALERWPSVLATRPQA